MKHLGIKINKVNVGAMHYQKGKREIAPFLYIDEEDLNYFSILKNRNVEFEGKDVPSSKPINVAEFLCL